VLAQWQKRDLLSGRDSEESRHKSMVWLMKRMIQDAWKMNAQLGVVYIPCLENRRASPPPGEISAALTSDLLFVDLAPVISGYYGDSRNPSLGLSDGHPNAQAHELIAREMYAVLDRSQVTIH
jgi:hypothetical protein